MKNKKIIFMGSPKIASDYLEALIKNNFIISAVFSQPPKKKSRGMKIIKSEVHQLANKNNIEVFCPNIFDKNTIEIVKKLNYFNRNVSFTEIETDKGHDSFLLDELELDFTINGFLESNYRKLESHE